MRLGPLSLENYEQLPPIAKQKKLVLLSPIDVASSEGLKKYVAAALEQKQLQTSILL